MEIPKRRSPPNRGLLIGTALVLILVFVVFLLLFFGLSLFTPDIVGKCVAVVNIDMPLSTSGSPPSLFDGGTPGSEEIANAIYDLNDRNDVGAVLFVFNSPGGSVVATREIYDSVRALKVPKVSYFREVAASGAYYVASGTDYIVSDPNAITGSIGVIATFTDMAGLLEKVGVNVTAIKSAPHKDIGSSYRNMTEEETAIFQNLINEVYDEFRSVVVHNRAGKLDNSKFEEITDGRIFSGRQAYKLGLVDQLGNKKDAILKAAQLAGIQADSADDVRICTISTSTPSGGLFGLESIFRKIQANSDTPTLNFK